MCKHYDIAVDMRLSGAELLKDAPAAVRICNGIGPDWFPAWLRWAVTKVNITLEPASWIHDMEYERGGGVVDRFMADARFLVNCFRCACFFHSAKSLRRYRNMLQALLLFAALRLGGQAAFAWH